jgi:hypothetical protein
MLRIVERTALLILSAALVSGCAPQLIKGTAESYVTAGKAVVDASNKAAAALGEAESGAISSRMAEDSQCPVDQDGPVYVRANDLLQLPDLKQSDPAFHDVATSLQSVDPSAASIQSDAGCKALFKCESKPGASECQTACYSKPEAQCIARLGHQIQLLSERSNDLTPSSRNKLENLATIFDRAMLTREFVAHRPIQDIVVENSVTALSGYLGVLAKIVDDKAEGIEPISSNVSKRLDQLQSSYPKVTGKDLPKDVSDDIGKVNKGISAINALFKDISKLSKQNADANQIKQTVLNFEKKNNINEMILSIKPILQSTDKITGSIIATNNSLREKALANAYHQSRDQAERQTLLGQLFVARASSGLPATADWDGLFNAMNESHESLVSLVNHPTDEQKKKIAKESFANFLMIASDIVSFYKLFA